MNINKLIRPSVLNLKKYSSARDEFSDKKDDFQFMDANENPFDTEYNRYPDPYQKSLKKKLADLKMISHENIVLGNGSDEILDMIIRVFCEPQKDEILSLSPSYGMYEVLAQINNVTYKTCRLNSKFQLDVKALLNEVSKNTKMIILCSPNNPSGALLQVASIKKVLDDFKGIVVIDEAYIDFSANSSFINELAHYENLIITQTFSKAAGLAGIRLGVCYASQAICKAINKIKLPYNVNTLTQQKAIQFLKNIDKMKSQIEIIKSERSVLFKVLESLNYVEKVYPSDANFILVKVDDANKRYQELLNFGIVVRNRTNVEMCENCLRISVGNPQENQKLIYVLKEIDR
ncbi:histidinol-phosphate transaminase [Psychroflexus halocasei]|uniref:Histidinol-phosphate aminotransferase n=1 Tax=Psychroflexus halocasei TaxID=908615 RepID=A0A1H3ZIH1_9FLAO|nr:histidinol-phosphate transaminase [Psychroflexus halocasei]SEA23559.1 histidinol-phosphate aminotransferase [Psychroflexus halocasei]